MKLKQVKEFISVTAIVYIAVLIISFMVYMIADSKMFIIEPAIGIEYDTFEDYDDMVLTEDFATWSENNCKDLTKTKCEELWRG